MTKFYRPVGDKACVFPIGSVIFTDNSTNPTKWYGGTWTRLSGGYIYAGVNNSYSVTSYTGTSTQGHAITTAQMPSHNHTASSNNAGSHMHYVQTFPYAGSDASYYVIAGGGPGGNVGSTNWRGGFTSWADNHSHTITVNSTGSGSAHTHNIAYIALACWRRTA